jgi:hypothetical protein
MTADKSKGVIVWAEGSVIRRLDFTVDESGDLQAGQPVTVLPRPGEEPLPGDSLHYTVWDVWGDATHDSLYIAVMQQEGFNSGPNAGASTRAGLIYDLNTLTERKLFDQFVPGDGTPEYRVWLDASDPSTLPDCYSVPYPQFVPTCYVVQSMRFNPSGTRLYLERNLPHELWNPGEIWRSVMRIETDDMAAGLPLADWDLAGPELVFASETLTEKGLEGPLLPRPENDPLQLPSPEYIAMSQDDGTDYPTSQVLMLLNADQCAAIYAPYASGILEAPFDRWQECKDESTLSYTGTMPGGPYSWQSPDTLLRGTFQGLETELFDIHRIYLSGALAGTEQLVIENASNPDSGY